MKESPAQAEQLQFKSCSAQSFNRALGLTFPRFLDKPDHLKRQIRKWSIVSVSEQIMLRCLIFISVTASSLLFSSDHKVEVDQACFPAKPQLVE